MGRHDRRYSAKALAQAQRARARAAKAPEAAPTIPDYANEERVELKSRLVRDDGAYYIAAFGSGVVYLEKRWVNYDGESFWIPTSIAKRKGIVE